MFSRVQISVIDLNHYIKNKGSKGISRCHDTHNSNPHPNNTKNNNKKMTVSIMKLNAYAECHFADNS